MTTNDQKKAKVLDFVSAKRKKEEKELEEFRKRVHEDLKRNHIIIKEEDEQF